MEDINLKETSFIYLIKKNSGEINNIRGFLNGFQINSGYIKFDNSKSLNINGNLKSDVVLNQLHLNNILKKKIQQNFKDFKLIGSLQKKFQIQFDQTLKITDYRLEASGNIQKSKIKLQEPQKYLFVKNKIKNIELEKSEFQIKL